MNLFKQGKIFDIILLTVAICVFLALSWILRGWLIDDAGISFAYARSIAEGYGMVHQQGAQPVEGISNPLWTFLFVPFFFIGFFNAIWISKGLSTLFILLSLFLILKINNRLTEGSRWAAVLALFGFVCSAPIVIWCSSGLENPLYLACVLTLLWVSISFIDAEAGNKRKYALLAGIITAAAALTRPEGILLLLIFPVTVIGLWLFERVITWKDTRQAAVRFTLSFAGIFGGYVLFRILYFGDWYPNTYYVKGGPDKAKALLAITLQGDYLKKFQEFSSTFLGGKGWLVLPICIIALFTLSLVSKKRRIDILILLLTFFVTCYTYLIMSQDWMGEYRFGTAVYPIAYLCLGVLLFQIFSHLHFSIRIRSVFGWFIAGCILFAIWRENDRRLDAFSSHPPTSYFTVVERFAKPFNAYAKDFGLDSASVLLPDIGGTLMHSELKVFDLGGLCDKTIATTRSRDQLHFHNYVFDTLKPTFIHTHGYFTAVSTFDDDPRFLKDYAPISQSIDTYVQRVYKAERISGDFIRRDAIVGKEAKLDSLRASLAK